MSLSFDGAAETEAKVTIEFGKNDLSDVFLVAGNHEFHCHKIMLANRSEYFSALFYSAFKEKDQKRIEIDVDPMALKNLLDIIYTGYSNDIQEMMDCNFGTRVGMRNDELCKRFWQTVSDVFSLVYRFLLTEMVFHSVQYTFMLHHGKCLRTVNQGSCYHCATKLTLAVYHNMNKYKEMSVSRLSAVEAVLDCLEEMRPDFSTEDISFLMSRPAHNED